MAVSVSLSYDLHTHSTASDGTLKPTDLVDRAHRDGVQVLALTDHDNTAGLAEAESAARQYGMELIPGVELSVTWEGKLLHVLGLRIDPSHRPLCEGTERLRELRRKRAIKMGEQLAMHNVKGAFEGAQSLTSGGMVTRTHFARFLVNNGYAARVQDVFKAYLKPGKPGFVNVEWAKLDDAVGWIRGAGGYAVLAHPLRYRLTASWMRRALTAFKEAGGIGIEVVCGSSTPEDIRISAELARRHGLLGSMGSDFHSPDNNWVQLGRLSELPAGVEPVWSAWRTA